MGYVITNDKGDITEQFNTVEELNHFILNALDDIPTGSLGLNQYVWPDDEALNTYFNNSNEIGKPSFNFIYTTEQFENLSPQ